MMNLMRISVVTCLLLVTSLMASAQGKFSIGIGGNLISNPDLPGLYSYIAPSLNLGYNLYQSNKMSIGIENTTSVRQVINNNSSELGFVTAFPVKVRYDLSKVF